MKDRREELRAALTEAVLARIDGSKELSDEELRGLIEQRIREVAGQRTITAAERVTAKRDVFNALRGLDVLQDLMDDPDITEIMVNGPNDIFIEKDGELYRSPVRFSGEKKLDDVIQKIAAGVNRVVNEVTCQRCSPAGFPERTDGDHPQVSEGPDHDGASDPARIHQCGGGGVFAGACAGRLQHRGERRNRFRQDYDAERPLGLYSGGRARRYH